MGQSARAGDPPFDAVKARPQYFGNLVRIPFVTYRHRWSSICQFGTGLFCPTFDFLNPAESSEVSRRRRWHCV